MKNIFCPPPVKEVEYAQYVRDREFLNEHLRMKMGSYNHFIGSASSNPVSSGVNGYYQFATFEIASTYMNAPISFEVCGRETLIKVRLYFTSKNSWNPSFRVFKQYKDPNNRLVSSIYAYQLQAGDKDNKIPAIWKFYSKKGESYDSIAYFNFQFSPYNLSSLGLTKWTWENYFVESLPEGYIEATISDTPF